MGSSIKVVQAAGVWGGVEDCVVRCQQPALHLEPDEQEEKEEEGL